MDMNWSLVVPTLVGGILAISGAILAQIYIKHKEREAKKSRWIQTDGLWVRYLACVWKPGCPPALLPQLTGMIL